DGAQLDVLAVGAGQCAILTTPGGKTCIIDAGSLARAECGEKVLVPFILHQRLPRPDAALLSHANADHYNAMPALLGRGWLRTVYLNEYFGVDEKGPGAAAVNELMGMIRQAGLDTVRLRPPRTIQLDGRTAIEVLWPPPGRDELSLNDTSLVLRITCDGRSVLVPGDLSKTGQAALSATGDSLKSDVLIMPHHGAWAETLPAFVRAVSPRTVIVSGSREPSAPVGADPNAAAFYERLAANHEYYSTLRNGWVRVRFGRHGITIRTMRK
ncbi:MAG: MBL fold metallo-hydrolase, partial [Phycisphaerae bacterium]